MIGFTSNTTTVIIGIVTFITSILFAILCLHKRSHSKNEPPLHAVIITKHFQSASFINNAYHNDMTLVVSSRRLAMLELDQQIDALAYDNPTDLTDSKAIRL